MNGRRMLLAAGAPTVSTLGAEDATFAEWGLPSLDRFGQTLTIGAAAIVRLFTFRIDDEETARS